MSDTNADQGTSRHASAMWALLIGIDHYKNVAPLRGAVNDVDAMRILLMGRYGVSTHQIRLLINEQATRAAILDAFESFLVTNAAIAYGDQILIHFCGHGSFRRDPSGSEPDGRDETIVAYDSRSLGVYDIPDKTWSALIDQLAAAKGTNITVLFDCCHAGSMTRGVGVSGQPRVRQIDPDERVLPGDLDASILQVGATARAARQEHVGSPIATRGADSVGWNLMPSHVLLAACRDDELAHEMLAPGYAHDQVWYGAFTYATLTALRETVPEDTYGQLHQRIVSQVKTTYLTQTPQCEGDRNRHVFAGSRPFHVSAIAATVGPDGAILLQAGYVHGLREGTELALFPVVTRAFTPEPNTPIATVRVTTVGATSARATRLDDSPGTGARAGAGAGAATLPQYARCVITKHAYAGLEQRVHLFSVEGLLPAEAHEVARTLKALSDAIRGQLPGVRPSPYLTISDDADHGADLYVRADVGSLHVLAADGQELAHPVALSSQDTLARQEALISTLHTLEHVARFRIFLFLTNEDVSSQLAGKIDFGLRRFIPNLPGLSLPIVERDVSTDVVVSVDPDTEANNSYVVELSNHSSSAVYPHLFTLSPDFSIIRLYPRSGQEEALVAGTTMYVGLRDTRERLMFYLPANWDASRDYLKAVFTSAPADLEVVEQGGLNVPLPNERSDRGSIQQQFQRGTSSLEALLQTLLDDVGTRFMRPSRSLVEDDWTTVTMPIMTKR